MSLPGARTLENILDRQLEFRDNLLQQAETAFLEKWSKDLKAQLLKWCSKLTKLKIKPVVLNFDTFIDQATLVEILARIGEGNNVIEFEEEINPFEMKFEEAIAYALNKKPILFEQIDEINDKVKNNCFWIKKSTEITTTEKVLKELQKTLDKGGTFKEFMLGIDSVVDKVGMGTNGWYASNVYRTNMMTFYNSGVYKQQMDSIEDRPYLLYDGVADNRQSKICQELNGKIYKATDPIWARIYPPNHFGCRSSVVGLSKEDVEAFGLTILSPTKVIKEMDLGGFEGNPFDSYWKKLEKNVIIKDKRLTKELNKIPDSIDMEARKKYFLNPKNVDKYFTGSKDNRKDLLKDILGVNDMAHLKIGVRKIDDWGYCSYYNQKDGIIKYSEIVLKNNDTRTKESRLKTLLHEFTHLTGDGKLKISRAIEETLAETIGHYTAGLYSDGNKIAVSYPEILVKTLPELRKITGFENCTTIESFGKKLFSELKKSDFDRVDMMKRLNIDDLSIGKTKDMLELVYKNKNNLGEIKEFFLDVQLSNYSGTRDRIEIKYNFIIEMIEKSDNLSEFISKAYREEICIRNLASSLIKKGWF